MSAAASSSAPSPAEELSAFIDSALALRLHGNTLFAKGDVAGALREWHGVLLRLKGLDGRISETFTVGTPGKLNEPDTSNTTTEHGIATSRVKSAIGLTYAAMSAAQLKKENHTRALEYALAAIAIDPNNTKARFREAQARLGLKDLKQNVEARKILVDLNKTSPDPVITNMLKQMDLSDKARDAKSATGFKGMYAKKPGSTASTTTTASTSK